MSKDIKLIVNYQICEWTGTKDSYLKHKRSKIFTFKEVNQITNKYLENVLFVTEGKNVIINEIQKL